VAPHGPLQFAVRESRSSGRYRREDVEAFIASGAQTEEVQQPKRLSEASLSPAARRLEEFKAKHASLHCERCDAEVKEADARIASHLELQGLDGPRDVHDWHCFCSVCYEELKQPQDALWTPKTLDLFGGARASARVRH
jgi:hypothetical protein